MSGEGRQIRDWQPGDGLRCSYANKAAIPCGKPVKTLTQTVRMVGRRSAVQTRILCELHAGNVGMMAVRGATLMATAQKFATERLISTHWDEYQGYLREAAEVLAAHNQPSVVTL